MKRLDTTAPRGKEQSTYNQSDLTGNYTTAFNKGKQQEVTMRFQHTKLSPEFHTEDDPTGFDC